LSDKLAWSLCNAIIDWQKIYGRHDLPWQNSTDAYRVWLSEVMLQQTQVATVLEYYRRFLEKFPTVQSLAQSPIDDVLALWSGLGYYSRARNLHRCAQQVCSQYGGKFPQSQAQLSELPGIGRSTAAAISAFAFGQSAAILDGNVKRVFCRIFGIEGYPGAGKIEKTLWQIAEREKPQGDVQAYTQGLMDLGATLCTRQKPRCTDCPVARHCAAFVDGRQAELPTRKPKKVIPIKTVNFELIRKNGEVLLERRPPSGIWGGLWCLPQFDTLPIGSKTLGSFEHGFTHFKMLATVFERSLAGDSIIPQVQDGHQRYVNRDAALALGLPAPIRVLLEAQLSEVFVGQ
jgi:A/G-specific adenine glycosylase